MRKAVDAVAHHEAHGAGVVIRPDRLGAEFALRRIEPRGDLVQRFVPRNPRELTGALRAGAAHRMHQPVGMMNALGIARDLGADDAGGIGLQLGAAHPADRGTIDHLDIERAGRRAIVRTGGMPDVDSWLLVHAPIATIKTRGRRAHLSGHAPAKNARGPCIRRRDKPRHWRGWPCFPRLLAKRGAANALIEDWKSRHSWLDFVTDLANCVGRQTGRPRTRPGLGG